MQKKNKKINVLILIFSLSLLAGFGIDLYAPSLPAMTQYFHTQASYTQFALVIYLLGYSAGQLIYGTWSDCYGRKTPLLVGMILYSLCSLSILLSHTIQQIIVIRFLQGVSGSTASAVSKAIVADSFPAEALAKYSTFLSVSWGLGPIIASFIGGYLQHYFGWQSTFILQSVQAALIGLFIVCCFKESNQQFIQFNLPAIAKTYLKIISHKLFIVTILVIAFEYAMLIIFNVQSPFLIQDLLHYSALQYGHIALAVGAGYFLGSLLNQWLVIYYSSSKILSVNIYLSIVVAVITVACVKIFPISIALITVPSFLLFTFGGMISPNCMAKNMVLFRESSGMAGAVMGCLLLLSSFVAGYLASFLSIKSLLPLSIVYLVLAMGYWILDFFFLQKNESL